MNLKPYNQTKIYGLNSYLEDFIKLYNKKILPNKILLSGSKGIGKSTLAYHLINYSLSINEDFSYDVKNFQINSNNKDFKLINNHSNPNFDLKDKKDDKKNIDINQIRSLIEKLNKSSLNSKPRFVLINNIEFLNTNSINALLKTLEEPNDNIYFILINNDKNVLSTLTSRCLSFKISLSHEQSKKIITHLIEDELINLINDDLLNYYFTPGKVLNLINFAKVFEINLKNLNLKSFLSFLIDNKYYNKDIYIKELIYDFIELFLYKKSSLIFSNMYNEFLKRMNDIKTYNLDEESFFLYFKTKLLNG